MRRQTSPDPALNSTCFHPFPKRHGGRHPQQEVRQETVRLLAQLLRQHRRGLFAVVHEPGDATMSDKIRAQHLTRKAMLYVRHNAVKKYGRAVSFLSQFITFPFQCNWLR